MPNIHTIIADGIVKIWALLSAAGLEVGLADFAEVNGIVLGIELAATDIAILDVVFHEDIVVFVRIVLHSDIIA